MLPSHQVKGIDGAITEIANEEMMRELAEIAGGECNAPWCVEPWTMLQLLQ